jgi:hypothetical protein
MILDRGRHRDATQGRCLLELVSVLAGERWTDHPRCVHPVLASIARRVNDACGDAARDRLVPLARPLIGTARAPEPLSSVLVSRCARAALETVAPPECVRRMRTALRLAERVPVSRSYRRWVAPSLVADAVTVLAEHAVDGDQQLVALLDECVSHSVCSLQNLDDVRS